MIHRAVVGAVLYNTRGEILLQLRDDKPTIPYPNHWTFFGGAVEAGETPDRAIARELREELDLELPLTYWKHYVCPARSIPGEVETITTLYSGLFEGDLSVLTLHEGQAMRFFTPQEARTLHLAFEQQVRLIEFLQEQGMS
jgi:8-oxo-dGTP diphosphatase